tara:strand:+ start:3490 stop:4017 length:528 start_codon:yes stop_codon:yes gene_type:complete
MIDFYKKDNFLNEEEIFFINDELFSNKARFPLYYHKDQCENDGNPFLSHGIILRGSGEINSTYHGFFMNIVNRFIFEETNLKPIKFLRSVVNFSFPFKGDPVSHVDHDEDHYQILVYLNDSSGPTIIFNNDNSIFKKITPKQGRVIAFNKTLHSASSPKIKDKVRAVFVTTFTTK